MEKIVGIYQQLDHDEILEVDNPTVSFVHFEKGSVFKSDDTCLGKIYLTSKKILILKLIVLKAKNMTIKSEEQVGSFMGQWFEIPLEYVTNVSTPKQGFF